MMDRLEALVADGLDLSTCNFRLNDLYLSQVVTYGHHLALAGFAEEGEWETEGEGWLVMNSVSEFGCEVGTPELSSWQIRKRRKRLAKWVKNRVPLKLWGRATQTLPTGEQRTVALLLDDRGHHLFLPFTADRYEETHVYDQDLDYDDYDE